MNNTQSLFVWLMAAVLYVGYGGSSLNAQLNAAYVMHKQGDPYAILDEKVELFPGYKLNPPFELVVQKGEYLHLIDNNGNLYMIETSCRINNWEDLMSRKSALSPQSLGQKYFEWLWEDLNREEAGPDPGVVYRMKDELKKLIPVSGTRVFGERVHFAWNPEVNTDTYYVHIRQKENQRKQVLQTDETEIFWDISDMNLSAQTEFEWALTTRPNMEKGELEFTDFTIHPLSELKPFKQKAEEMKEELDRLGFSPLDVQVAIGQYLKIQYPFY